MSDEWVMVPRDLLQRVDAALQRHLDRHAPMRIPVDQTDSDLVQSDVQALIAAPAAPQQAEPVAWMKPTRDSCYLRSAETMLAIHEDFDGIARTGWTPLYLHPPPAEVQAGACPHCGSDCNERDELTKAEREITRLLAEVEALRADALKQVDCRQCKHATNRGCHSTALCERGELFEATPPWQFYDAARAAQGDKT